MSNKSRETAVVQMDPTGFYTKRGDSKRAVKTQCGHLIEQATDADWLNDPSDPESGLICDLIDTVEACYMGSVPMNDPDKGNRCKRKNDAGVLVKYHGPSDKRGKRIFPLAEIREEGNDGSLFIYPDAIVCQNYDHPEIPDCIVWLV